MTKDILNQMKILETIKEDGNVVMIKFDGERESDPISIVVSFPKAKNNKIIQYHGDNLAELLEKLTNAYL